MDAPGRLSIVGTPIGNLEDLSARAVRVLGEADVVYCEDTRRTRKLFSVLGLPTPRLVRLDRHTEAQTVGQVVAAVEAGRRAVLVSDAGMPTISDPGQILVKGAADAGVPLDVVPGPCAVSAALALSGIPAAGYRFAGFLPRKGKERRTVLADLAAAGVTTVVYEAPARVARTIADLAEALGPDRELAAARELTKLHEEVWRGTLAEGVERFGAAGEELRGEWVLVVGPASEAPREVGETEIAAALAVRLQAGEDRKTAVAAVAVELAVPKRTVYELSLRGRPAAGS